MEAGYQGKCWCGSFTVKVRQRKIVSSMCVCQGEGTQPPSLLSPPSAGSVRLCNVLPEIAGQPGTDFSHRGERSTLYTVYITLYKHLAGSFWVLRQYLQQVAPNQEKPHTTPLHSLIYSIYISVVFVHQFNKWENRKCKDDWPSAPLQFSLAVFVRLL